MRKKIRQGKMYFKGTSILLKKRCKISAQNLLKKADSSGSLRVLFECPSRLRRISVASSSGMLRQLFDCASGRSRSVLEALPKPSRRSAKPVSTMSRRSLEAEPKVSRRGRKALSSSDFRLTNFAPASAFYAVGLEFSSGSHRAKPIKTRCGLDENPMKCKNSAGINLVMVDYSLAQETHKLDYSATLVSPLLSPCYTQGQLNDCTRPKQQKRAFQKVGDSELFDGTESKQSVLRFFMSICKALAFRINTLFGLIGPVVQRALKCFLYVADYKRAYRMILTCLFLCLVSMFSLSAQTPRKDSGADGLIKANPLLIGQKLPEEFWEREYLVYNNGDTTRQTLEAYRGKLLVLDFWATWCAICLGQMKEKDELFSRFPADAKLIYVNPTQTKDTYTNIAKIQDRLAERSLSGKFQSIIEEDYLQQLFPNYIYPRYVWIGPRGDLIGLTLALSVTDGHIKDMLNLINPKDGKK
ncbi:TlpA family protein disulfide reductase [Sphingobacterium multivorum]|uniref:TlpA family protein disulfide reductase n=2 Tax=Sphingobacterium TaxID=28453 RepID=UPI00289B07BE|nr:TlpA disulfide reductase family protein [Sphingobacterium multivorum]